MNTDENKDTNNPDTEKVLDLDADDVTIESDDTLDDSVIAEENMAETIKKLRAKLKKSQADAQEYLTGWQRAKADFVNARKRDEEERKEFIKFSNERLIESLIPVLESFDLAMANKETWEKVDKNWRMGVEYIYSQLKKTLNESGLEEVNPIGLKFDPARDEAAEYLPVTEENQDHIITQVIQKGYSLNKKQMRPPKVKVGEFKK
ncbi:MAG: nucleotide exchange factor GrpE [Candidatus Pacebacteria bacterium]|nr:nucleotide exchange factor GrpE [Candidatus Paceibacterota bacterium]